MQEILKKYSISDVTSNSTEVVKNSVFVAIKGAKFNSNNFINEARENGVSFIITDDKETYDKHKLSFPIYLVEDSRKALAEIAVYLYKDVPSNLIAVTGTSGKSSVVHYIGQLLSGTGKVVATIGTLGVRIYSPGNKQETLQDSGLTTPDAISFNKTLSLLKKMGVDYCAIEVSSIGLEQYRIFGRKFKVAAFTSFSQDHLDYHHTMDRYLEQKLKLFDIYMEDESVAIINSDMVYFSEIQHYLDNIKRGYISVGENGSCKIKLKETGSEGQHFKLKYNNSSYELFTKVIGAFQVSNISISLLMISNLGIDISELIPLVPKLSAPIGRLEKVDDSEKGSRIYIDYSHKPDALENVLKELKAIASKNKKRLLVVFGCGGNRDKIKRPIMGAIASKYADLVIITDDNPRYEDPSLIRKEILKGAGALAIEIEGRQEAIKFAIENLTEGDLLLIAGKGHEEYQIVGEQVIPFSDKEVAMELLSIAKPL